MTKMDKDGLLIELLQMAVGARGALSKRPSEMVWKMLFHRCQMQTVTAFAFPALDQLSQAGQKAPVGLVCEWLALSEQVKTQNELMNREAARLTKLFEDAGHRTAILKGQANARLYPDKMSRQPGDIDIWVSGGKEKVIETARRLGLLKGDIAKYSFDGDTTVSRHHIHLSKNEHGIDVEVHFLPSSGNYNPFTNRRLQAFLEAEIQQENELVAEGFRVPSLAFALVMQLAHIQRHLVSGGIGMRQIMDYYYLLKSDQNGQRVDVVDKLKRFGLKHIAGAMMWVLHEKFGLEADFLISPKDERRGQMLLQQIMDGGNFGRFHPDRQHGLGRRILAKHQHRLKMFRFDFSEAFWIELMYVSFFIKTIPARIKRGKWSLG